MIQPRGFLAGRRPIQNIPAVDVMYGQGRCFGSRAEIMELTMSFKQTKLYVVILTNLKCVVDYKVL